MSMQCPHPSLGQEEGQPTLLDSPGPALRRACLHCPADPSTGCLRIHTHARNTPSLVYWADCSTNSEATATVGFTTSITSVQPSKRYPQLYLLFFATAVSALLPAAVSVLPRFALRLSRRVTPMAVNVRRVMRRASGTLPIGIPHCSLQTRLYPLRPSFGAFCLLRSCDCPVSAPFSPPLPFVPGILRVSTSAPLHFPCSVANYFWQPATPLSPYSLLHLG